MARACLPVANAWLSRSIAKNVPYAMTFKSLSEVFPRDLGLGSAGLKENMVEAKRVKFGTQALQRRFKRKRSWLLGFVIFAPVAFANSGCKESASQDESASCIRLPKSVLNSVAAGEELGVGMVPVSGFAIKSADFNNVYFFAIEFQATGIENQVGVWARNGIESGLILSVDGTAKAFTIWQDASKTDAQISGGDRNISIAKSCL